MGQALDVNFFKSGSIERAAQHTPHSTLEYISPNDYEAQLLEMKKAS
jgi:hypothetical protein